MEYPLVEAVSVLIVLQYSFALLKKKMENQAGRGDFIEYLKPILCRFS
jgi:hypothetical protein